MLEAELTVVLCFSTQANIEQQREKMELVNLPFRLLINIYVLLLA